MKQFHTWIVVAGQGGREATAVRSGNSRKAAWTGREIASNTCNNTAIGSGQSFYPVSSFIYRYIAFCNNTAIGSGQSL